MIYKINNISDIDKVLDIATIVFDPTKKEKRKYQNREEWLEKIEKDGLLVSVYKGDRVIGFSISYKKSSERLHIWNVGVLPEFRKQGVWRKMYEIIFKYSVDKNFRILSINTYKIKFPAMYSFLKREGFEEYETELRKGIRKTKFQKYLQ